MSQQITLQMLKQHLRLELDDQAEHENLQVILLSAIDYASQFLGRPIPWQDSQGISVLPASVKSAVLLIAADLYFNREASTASSVKDNPIVEKMLHFHRVGLGV